MNKKSLYLALVLAGFIESIVLFADHQPMFFFGDSSSYIWTALTGWLPSDRSFVYGYFIRLISVTTESLTSLVIAQVFLAVTTCVVSVHLLIRYFQVRSWIALAAVFMITLEPLQLLYTRYVMTETLALFVFVFYVWVVLEYLEDVRLKWLVLMQILAVVMISVRFAFIPLVWICALAIPVIAIPAIVKQARAAAKKPFGLAIFHIVLSVCLLFTFTTIYKYVHGYLQNKPPAYTYESGFFAISYVVPMLEPEDFADKNLGEQVLSNLSFPIADRRARIAQHWMEGGVVSHLRKLEYDQMKADKIALKAALHAVIHKPFAFLQLGWQTFTDYFDKPYLRFCMKTELGDRRLGLDFLNLIKTRFHYSSDTSSALDLNTPTGRYFLRSGHWIQLLSFLPLIWGLLLVSARATDQRRIMLMMVLFSLAFVSVALFLAERPTPRYLHIMAWLACMAAAVGLNRVLPRQKNLS